MNSLTPMILVTIIIESLSRPAIESLLKRHHLTGYTLFQVEGVGADGGARHADMDADANLQIEVITTHAKAKELLLELERDYFTRYAMIAYASEVRVMRAAKFTP